MKIEKVNENQIRCTLTKEDLADRQIKLSELAYGSEKARGLFRDMIEQANYEFGFEVNDIPLMVEAIPLSGENIILQITKVEYPEELDTRFSKFSESDEEEEVNDEPLFPEAHGAADILDVFQKMKETVKEKEEVSEPVVKEQEQRNITKMFQVRNLEQLEKLSHVLSDYYAGESDVYKDEKRNRFYLLVRKGGHTPEEFNKVCNVISEYAGYVKYTSATEAYLKEHGKLILKGNALAVLNAI